MTCVIPFVSRWCESFFGGGGGGGVQRGHFNEVNFDTVYTLHEQLGKGAFATVYRSRHRETGRVFAAKVFNREGLQPKDETAIRKESDILLQLSHPNVIECFGFFESPTKFHMVLEVVEGGELFDRIVRRSFYSEKVARDLVKILLSSLQYCHSHDVVHRDLKPENLLLMSKVEDSSIKLADFGLAEYAPTCSLLQFVGSPGYMAPEILNWSKHGKPVDMWSVGVITYVLLGGYMPFDVNASSYQRRVKAGQFQFHSDSWSDVSEEAKDLIRRLLNVDPNRRLTAEQALQHVWICKADSSINNQNLNRSLTLLKKFNAKRKFRIWALSLIVVAEFERLRRNNQSGKGKSNTTRPARRGSRK